MRSVPGFSKSTRSGDWPEERLEGGGCLAWPARTLAPNRPPCEPRAPGANESAGEMDRGVIRWGGDWEAGYMASDAA